MRWNYTIIYCVVVLVVILQLISYINQALLFAIYDHKINCTVFHFFIYVGLDDFTGKWSVLWKYERISVMPFWDAIIQHN